MDFRKTLKYQNFVSIRPVGAELFRVEGRAVGRADRQTGMTQLIFAFRNIGNALKSAAVAISPCSWHEGIGRNGGSTPFILNLGAGWMLLVSFTPRVLYLRRNIPPTPNTYLTGDRVAAGAAWVVLEKKSTSYLSRGSNRYFLVV
jgi:hypothetical protein